MSVTFLNSKVNLSIIHETTFKKSKMSCLYNITSINSFLTSCRYMPKSFRQLVLPYLAYPTANQLSNCCTILHTTLSLDSYFKFHYLSNLAVTHIKPFSSSTANPTKVVS